MQVGDVEGDTLAAVGDVQHGHGRGLDLLLFGALLAVFFAVEHVGAGDFVVATAHQAEFDLVLHVFDVEGAAAGARAHQGAHDALSQAIDRLAHAGRSRALRAMHGQKSLHHRHGNLARLEGHHGAVAADDLVVGQRMGGDGVVAGVRKVGRRGHGIGGYGHDFSFLAVLGGRQDGLGRAVDAARSVVLAGNRFFAPSGHGMASIWLRV